MAISIQCKCGKRFKARDDQAGKKFRCAKCGATVVVPQAETEAVYAIPLVGASASRSSHATFSPESLDQLREVEQADLSPTIVDSVPTTRQPSRVHSLSALILLVTNPNRWTIRRVLIALAVLGGSTVLLCGGALFWASRSSRVVSRYNSNNVRETAHWIGDILKPLNSIRDRNEIVRNDAIQAEIEHINRTLKPLLGENVAWEMRCAVSEGSIYLMGAYSTHGDEATLPVSRDESDKLERARSWDRRDIDRMGYKEKEKALNRALKDTTAVEAAARKNVEESEKSYLAAIRGIAPQSRDIAISVLEDRPKDYWKSHSRLFLVDVPERINREFAAKLTDRVTVNGTIKEFEIGTYQDNDHGRRFLIYIYLTKIRLATK
jgi:hypothetical protein